MIPVLRHRRARCPLPPSSDSDPLEGMASFFDLGIVFALGFMLASMLASQQTAPVQSSELPERVLVRDLAPSGQARKGEGVRLGTAYRLKSGEIVYVPDAAQKGD